MNEENLHGPDAELVTFLRKIDYTMDFMAFARSCIPKRYRTGWKWEPLKRIWLENKIYYDFLLHNEDALERGQSFIVCGKNLSGKSYFGAITARLVAEMNNAVLWSTAIKLQDYIITNQLFDPQENVSWYARAKKVDFLVIDNLGAEASALAKGRNAVLELIEDRHRDKKSTMCVVDRHFYDITDMYSEFWIEFFGYHFERIELKDSFYQK